MISETFLRAIRHTDEFTKRELFSIMGQPMTKGSRTLEIKFKDGSYAFNVWVRIGNRLEVKTYAI